MLQKLAPYRKTIVAVIGSALTWAIANYANDPEVSKYLSLVSALLTAAGVYQVTNKEVK
jgi:hypothetical protein